MLKCICIDCNHIFYSLLTDCDKDFKVYCPLCQGMVDVDDLPLENDKNWGRCRHGGCQKCKKKNSSQERVVD